MLAQHIERTVGERYVAILATLAMDVEQLARAVDVGDLEAGPFHEPEAAGVDRGEADAIHGNAHGGENPPHLLAAQDHGELLLALGAGDVEHGPLPRERLLIEELEATERDGVGAAGDLLDSAQLEQVLPDLVFRELVGGGMIEPGQLCDGMDVGLDRTIGVAAELEVVDHALAERCHEALSEKGMRGSDTVLRSSSSWQPGDRATEWQCYPPQAD